MVNWIRGFDSNEDSERETDGDMREIGITDIDILKSMYRDLETQLAEFAELVALYRCAEKEVKKMRRWSDGEKRAEAHDKMLLLQKCVDSELSHFLEER